MDAISFALSIPPVVAGLLRIIEYVNAMQDKFEAAPTAMASITAQCSIMNIMLGRLQRLDVSHAVPSEQERTRLLRDVGAIISGCTGTLTSLENLLLSLHEEDGSSFTQVGKKGRFLFLWYDGRIKDLLSELSSYHSSITLLLATAQCHKLEAIQADIGTLLERTATEKAPSKQSAPAHIPETESLNWNSIASDDFSTTAIHFDPESRRSSGATFEFDHIIANSRIYQRTLAPGRSRTFEQSKPIENNATSSRAAKLELSEKPERLIIDVEESVEVKIVDAAAGLEKLSKVQGSQTFKPPRRSNTEGTFVLKAARNAFARNRRAVRHEVQGRASATPQQPTLELVVTGYGQHKLSVARVFNELRNMEPSDTTTVSNHAIHVIDGRSVFVHVVDTPLHEDHYLVRELFLKPAHCFMLVYDVASRTSFEKIVEYRNQLLAAKGLTPEASAAHQVPIVLVGNDAHGFGARQISTDEGEDLAALLRCPYIETSSATGDHVEKAFRRIMDAVRDPGGPVKDGYQS